MWVRKFRGIRWISGAAVGGVLLAACDGSDVDAQDPSMVSMLSLVPADVATEPQPVQIAVYTRAAEQDDLTIPDLEASSEGVDDYFRDLFGNEVDASGVIPSALLAYESRDFDMVQDEFGYAPQAITADIQVGAPPDMVEAAVGEFVSEDVTAATRDTFGDEATTDEVDGVPVARWFEDGENNLEEGHALSRIGSSGRLAIADEHALLHGRTDETIENLVDAYHGDVETLSDHENLVAVAEALDEHEARSAVLSDEPVSQLPRHLDEGQRAAVENQTIGIGEYQAYGVGITSEAADDDSDADDSDAQGAAHRQVRSGGGGAGMPATGVRTGTEETGSQLLLVLVGADSASAEQLADGVEQVARDGRSWHGFEWTDQLVPPTITVNDTVVTASFEIQGANQTWYQLWTEQDSLLYTG